MAIERAGVALFGSGFVLCLSLCLDLGAVNIAILNTGLARGGWAAWWVGFGSSLGDLFYALVSGALVAWLARYAAIRAGLWLGGGLILFAMAWKTWQGAAGKHLALAPAQTGARTKAADPVPAWRDALRGLGVMLASPSAILWFAGLGGPVIAGEYRRADGLAGNTRLQWFFGGFFTASLTYSVAIALLLAWGRRHVGDGLAQQVARASALLFAALGAKVLVDGARSFL